MLVSSGKASRGEAAFTLKHDGARAELAVDGRRGTIRVVTRSGRRVEAGVPELAGAALAAEGRLAVFDGELIAGDGMPTSFYRLGGRMAAESARAIERGRRQTPVTFVAFDLLWLDGAYLIGDSYRERRRALEALEFAGPNWATATSFSDGDALYEACVAIGAEGVVGRRLDRSPYLPGRRSSSCWKRKCPAWIRDHAALRVPRRS